MNIFELMDSKSKSYTKTDRSIYDRCKKNYDIFSTEPIAVLTEQYNLSQASLTRFAKKLGFSGFNEFQFRLSQDIAEKDSHAQMSSTEIYSKVPQEVKAALDPAMLKKLAEDILQADTIYPFGYSFSSLPGDYLAMSLRIQGIPHCEVPNLAHLSYRFKENDIIILFSVAGNVTGNYSVYRTRSGSKKVLVTMNPKHRLIPESDYVFILPDINAAYGASAVACETIAFILFCDALSETLHQLKKAKQ